MKLGSKISLIVGSSIFFNSCIKDDNFEIIPAIEFESYELHYSNTNSLDSATYTFSFKDGDGDLGAVDSIDFNCFLRYEEKNGDSITLFPLIEDRQYTLPNLTPNAKDKNIEGIISLIIKPAPIFNVLTDSAYRYTCYITDRAGNESNRITPDWNQK